ncbi:MAG: hypothetical protein E6J91_34010 [Deltaproteobacteria bacterium]|nr:MAG: hypothetical protein E6J91_34010 [Deltaproteobacteria bacterium]
MPETFGEFLADSLAAIEREAPACARAIAAALGPAVIELVVDGERIAIRPGPEIAVGRAAEAAPCAEVATTARALLALLDGGDELYPAIVDNRVRVRAAPRDAERLFDTMRWFVEGCARTRAAPELLAAYRGRVDANV